MLQNSVILHFPVILQFSVISWTDKLCRAFIAAAQIAYPNKFTTFLTKLIKYLHNLIEIYMYIGYRLGQRQRQTPVVGIGTAVMRNVTAHSMLLQSEFS